MLFLPIDTLNAIDTCSEEERSAMTAVFDLMRERSNSNLHAFLYFATFLLAALNSGLEGAASHESTIIRTASRVQNRGVMQELLTATLDAHDWTDVDSVVVALSTRVDDTSALFGSIPSPLLGDGNVQEVSPMRLGQPARALGTPSPHPHGALAMQFREYMAMDAPPQLAAHANPDDLRSTDHSPVKIRPAVVESAATNEHYDNDVDREYREQEQQWLMTQSMQTWL